MSYTGEVGDVMSLAYPNEDWFFEAVGASRTDSGERVTQSTALTHGPVWQAVNILAGDVGQLPIQVWKKDGRERQRQDRHAVDWLLTMEPNPYQTPAVFKETMMAWSLLWGNGCAYIARNGVGSPEYLIPLAPEHTRPVAVNVIDDDTGVEYAEWMIETDFGDGKKVKLLYSDVFHLRGLATDGFWGLSAVQVAKNVIGSGLALRKHGNRTFKNSAAPGMALTFPGPQPKPEVVSEYRSNLERMHSGAENAGKWLLLWGGATANPMTMNNTDAQWLESMDLDREFIAGLFNLPPYKLGAMKNSAVRANLEQQNTDYLTACLGRHLNKFREEGERKLFNYGERRLRRLFLKWVVEAFLRGDLAARGAYYAQAKTGEWMTTNEIRELEDLPPIKGGDELRNPAINPVKEQPTQPPAPDSTPKDPQPTTPGNARASSIELIASQIGALLDVEASAAEKNIPAARNAVKWAERYYERYGDLASTFVAIPCRLAAALGVDVGDWRDVMALHARDSLNRFLSMAGIASKASLPEVAKEFANSIREQRAELAKKLIGEHCG